MSKESKFEIRTPNKTYRGKAKIKWMQKISTFINEEITSGDDTQDYLDLIATLQEMTNNLIRNFNDDIG